MSAVDLRELAIDRGDPAAPRIRTRKRLLTRYVLPSVLIMGFLSLVVWASRDFLFPAREVTVLPVFSTTAEVRQEGTPLFKAAGWVEPRPTPVRVAALASGVVERLLVVEDQPVKAGDAIAELIKDDAQLAHDRAKADRRVRAAEIEQAKATFEAAKTRFKQPVHLEAALGEAEASLAKIETQLKNLPFAVRRAEADYEAMRQDYNGKLAAKGVVAGVNIDVAKSKADSAKALVEELKNRIASLSNEQVALTKRRDALQTQLELLADEIQARDESLAKLKVAEARSAQTDVALAEAKLRLDRMTITAPIDGRIFRLVAHPGARIGSGMTQITGHDGSTVVTMYDPQRLQVRVDVRFEDLPNVSLNQLVEIDNPALSASLTGKVLFISSEADIQKNTLQVKVDIPDPSPLFKPEMLVDVTFLSPRQPEETGEPSKELKLYVLQQLVKEGENGPFVWVADQSEGVARKVRIVKGTVGNNGLVEITSGLTVASRLISSGTEELRHGQRINITGEDGSFGTDRSVEKAETRRTPNRLPSGGRP